MAEQAEATLGRLMRAYDVHDEGALAIHMGRDVSTLRVWRSRDQVPLLALTDASKATGYSVQWLRGEPGAPESASNLTPDDASNRMAVSERERALLESYRATDEDGRAAVEVVTSTLAQPGTKAGKGRGQKLAAIDTPVTVLVSRSPERAWLANGPVKDDTIKLGGGHLADIAALLPVKTPSESRPLVLSVSMGAGARKADYEVIPKFLGVVEAGPLPVKESKRADKPADSAGNDGLDQAGDMAFSFDWLRDNLGHTSGRLASIKVHGDSMANTLVEGETIIIDTAITRVDVSGIYVIRAFGDRLVKRIERMLDGSLVIKADNPKYSAETVQAGQVASIAVLGRMVWPKMR